MSTTRLQEVQICFGFGKQPDIATANPVAAMPLSHSESGRAPIRIWARLNIELRNRTSAPRFLSGCPRDSRSTTIWPLVAQSSPHFGGRSFTSITPGGHR